MKKIKKLLSFMRLVKPGFTLAEVLITLSILGVVAAITVPSILNQRFKNEIETKLAKFYSALVEAAEREEIESGKPWGAIYTSSVTDKSIYNKFITEFMPKYFKGELVDYTGSNVISYKKQDGSSTSTYLTPDKMFKFADKSCLIGPYSTCGNSDFSSYIYDYDINCSKGPNIYGIDVYRIHFGFLKKNQKFGISGIDFNVSSRSNYIGWCKTDNYGSPGCFQLLVKNKFKFPSDYPIKF